MDSILQDDEYLGVADGDRLSRFVKHQMAQWNISLATNGLLSQWLSNYRIYYNMRPTTGFGQRGTQFGLTGDNAQYLNVRVAHFRNIITHWLNMMFAKPPALKAAAANTDPDSISSVALYDQILDYEMRCKKLHRFFKKTAEIGLIFGTGGTLVEWDVTSGDPYTVQAQQDYTPGVSMQDSPFAQDQMIGQEAPQSPPPNMSMGGVIYTGDLRMRSISPFDFLTDLRTLEWDDAPWVIVRDYVNKFVLAAQYPDLADRIVKVKNETSEPQLVFTNNSSKSDMIPIYKFYHKPVNGLMPEGRYTLIVDDGVVLYDGPNPYGCLPFFLLKPQDWIGTFYGQTVANDIAPIQLFNDLVMTQIATQVAHHGVPNIWYEAGSNITPTRLSGGMRAIASQPGFNKPESLNLLNISPEMFNLTTLAERLIETVSGINSVARGSPNENLKSGVALGIVQSQAVQFASGFQQAVVGHYEDVGNHILKLHKKFADTERVVAIMGKNKANEVKRWKSEDISPVENVYVEPVDPVSQTIAGKMEMAKDLIQNNMIRTPQEYLTVATTGEYESIYDSEMKELNYVRRENAALLQGRQVQMLATDDHQVHFNEHRALTFDDMLREKAEMDPQGRDAMVLKNILNHIQQHQQQMGPPMPPPEVQAQMAAQAHAQGQPQGSPPQSGGPPQPPPGGQGGQQLQGPLYSAA